MCLCILILKRIGYIYIFLNFKTFMNKEEAKQKIKQIIERYEKLNSEGKLKTINEANTKNWFIEPLFEALGWNMRSEEVSMEEKVSKGRADYAFRYEGVLKFFVEAKSIKEDLDNIKFSKQTIEYGWNKGITWAILTDFEGIKVFNCEWNEKNVWRNVLFSLSYKQFLDEFDKIWLLSRESFKIDSIGKYADLIGKRIPRKKISDYLLSEFIDWRNKLLINLKKLDYSDEDRDEIVQTLLDRLIFIRNCEDRNYEEKMIGASLREFKNHNKSINKSFKEIFRYYDKYYDSKIFEFRDVDKVDFDEKILINIIERLYKTKDGNIAYDFSLIDADILGNLYEQYLSHISKKSSEKNQAKKKSQGIYYTPTYVVDYIVKNTIGELLKNKKIKQKDIKILDPACGSGSFLIKVFDYLINIDKQKNIDIDQTKLDLSGASATYGRKVEILKDNIFGVDLDPKAVEIAQLNLLLKATEKKKRLPMLQENIRVGDSLFDEEKYAEKKAFDWDSNFQKIMNKGGFDIIIGNPPYVDIKGMPHKQVEGLFEKYKSAENRINLYSMFVERAIQLLKKGGYFGFIIPNSILFNSSYKKMRRLLLDNVNLVKIVRMPDNVFKDAKVETIILIFKKKDSSKKTNVNILIYDKKDQVVQINKKTAKQTLTIKQSSWEKNSDNIFNIFANEKVQKLLENIEKNTTSLIKLADFSLGITPYDKYKGHSQSQIKNKDFHADSKKDESYKKLLVGADIIRYGVFWNTKNWIKYGKWLGAQREERFFNEPHIVIRQIVSGKPLRIYAGYTEEELINAQIGFNILTKDETKLKIKYILALLNSKLINFYHTEKYLDKSKNLFQKILIQNAKKFPIKVVDNKTQEKICLLVNKMLILNKKYMKIKHKQTSEKESLEKEIKKVDKDIDNLIYDIYNLTKKEKEIIEKNG